MLYASGFNRSFLVSIDFTRRIFTEVQVGYRIDWVCPFPPGLCSDADGHTFVAYNAVEINYNPICLPNGEYGFNYILMRVGFSDPSAPGSFFGGDIVFEWYFGDALNGVPFGTRVPNQAAGCASLNNRFKSDGQGTATIIGVPSGFDSDDNLICDPVVIGDKFSVAENCDDPADKISVDLATNTEYLPGILFNSKNYRLTAETTEDPPVPVVWTRQVCPPPPGENFYIAVRCRNTGSATEDPPTVVYAVNPAVGVGAGRVIRTTLTPNPNCPDSTSFCVRRTEYQPTATPASGPATARVSHVQGTACAAGDSFTCQACPSEPTGPDDGPTLRPRGFADDDMLDAMGFDPDEERRKLLNGGDCGCSPSSWMYE
jgi:hypothetical protein